MKKLLSSLSVVLLASQLQAQVGIGTATPDGSAQLEISSTNKGLLIPRMPQANRPGSPATGLLIYQTNNTPGFYYFDGTWKQLGGWGLSGNAGTSTSNFIGTTDANDLYFKVNNQPAGRISDSDSDPLLLGYQAGLNNTSSRATVFGNKALSVNNSAHSITAIGWYALENNSTGYGNTAIGAGTLRNNTTGGYNIGVGAAALEKNTIGNYNAGVGYFSLSNNNTGNSNTALGYAALSFNETGSGNTAIGYYAGPDNGYPGLSNTTSIGNGAFTTASNQVRIGNSSVTSIGGYANWTNLSDIRYKKNIQPQKHGLDFILALQPITYNMDVKGLNNHLYGNKADSINSDAINVKSIATKESILYSGFSAQQVEEAAKKVGYNFSGVHKPETDKDHYTLEYATFVVPLVKAVQEQQTIIETQNKKIEQQEKQLADLLKEIEKIKTKLK